MNLKVYYTENMEAKYKLHIRLWNAFKGFFGFSNPYDEAVKHISHKSIKEALVSDLKSIRQDSHKVLTAKNLNNVEEMNEEECAVH